MVQHHSPAIWYRTGVPKTILSDAKVSGGIGLDGARDKAQARFTRLHLSGMSPSKIGSVYLDMHIVQKSLL